MKHFQFKILGFLILLIVLSALAVITLIYKLWFVCLLTVIFIAIDIHAIIRLTNKQEENLKKLLASIRFSDYSITFKNFKKLSISEEYSRLLEETLHAFRTKLYHLEEEHQYYNSLLSTIDFGIIILRKNGDIHWLNRTVLDEFGLTKLHTLNELRTVHTELPEILTGLRPGTIRILKIGKENEKKELVFNAIAFKVKGRELSLISIKNIHSVLEKNELESWQKLISVLTHEIMNSIAPIISLSETLSERILEDEDNKDAAVMQQALQAIHRRSKGLLAFVHNYRRLTRIPAPEISLIHAKNLFSELKKLHRKENIEYHFIHEPQDLVFYADRSQIEQVLINLIKNAEEAFDENQKGVIEVVASRDIKKNLITIVIRDNGKGIVPEALEKIFVPFFTTKPTGSGIGLSLCKQILTLHQGNISVTSGMNQGSVFTLHLPDRKSPLNEVKSTHNS